MREKLGFLGAGAMAGALIRGLLAMGTIPAANVLVTNRRNSQRLGDLVRETGVRSCSREEVVREADVLFLAMKPQDVPLALEEIAPLLQAGQRLISLAAGIGIPYLERHLPGAVVLRAMPNTSCRVGASATAISLGCAAGEDDADLARRIFASIGKAVVVPEGLMDAVTGLSGSGPAYFYFMVEALAAAGEKAGLEAATAGELALATFWGAAKMLAETGEDPAVLRRQVTSPGGTTMAGVGALEEGGFTELLAKAVAAAADRSKEIGGEYE